MRNSIKPQILIYRSCLNNLVITEELKEYFDNLEYPALFSPILFFSKRILRFLIQYDFIIKVMWQIVSKFDKIEIINAQFDPFIIQSISHSLYVLPYLFIL